jgi:hypothetical protein
MHRFFWSPKILSLALVFVIGLSVGFFLDQSWQFYRANRILTSDEATMEALSKIILLPEELPSIATVIDTEALNDEPFFQKAENGDKVVIFQNNKRAYLFRPKENRIIDMTVIAVGEAAPSNIPVFQTNE